MDGPFFVLGQPVNSNFLEIFFLENSHGLPNQLELLVSGIGAGVEYLGLAHVGRVSPFFHGFDSLQRQPMLVLEM